MESDNSFYDLSNLQLQDLLTGGFSGFLVKNDWKSTVTAGIVELANPILTQPSSLLQKIMSNGNPCAPVDIISYK